MSRHPQQAVAYVFGRDLEVGMTLLGGEGHPRQILEISGYLEDPHPALPGFRVATCPPDSSVVVYDRAVYRVVVGQ